MRAPRAEEEEEVLEEEVASELVLALSLELSGVELVLRRVEAQARV